VLVAAAAVVVLAVTTDNHGVLEFLLVFRRA
jgi:hypothetical protein